jgi:HEAT repeat protein
MSPWRRTVAALGVQAGEGRLVLLLVALSFSMGVTRLFVQTSSGALFLVEFDAQSLSYVYIAVAIVVPALGLAYTGLESRLPLPGLLLGNVAILFVVLAAIWGVSAISARWSAFALAVWYEAIWAMMNVSLWGLAGRLVDVRQARRLFPLISAGDVIAAILGGAVTPFLVGWLGMGSLFAGGLAGLAGALGLVAYAARVYADSLGEESEDEAPTHGDGDGEQGLHRRYVALILVLGGVSCASFYFIDNIFYSVVEERYRDEAALASFLGPFWAVVSALTLVGNVALTGRILGRYGVRAGLLLLPILTAAATALMVGSGTLLALPALVFAFAALTNLLDWVIRESIFQSALLTLYQPLPARLRLRAQALNECVSQPLAQGVAGIALLGLGLLGLGVLHLGVVLLAMLAVCVALTLPLGRDYAAVVVHALDRRLLGRAAGRAPGARPFGTRPTRWVASDDQAAVATLRRALTDPRPPVVLYALRTLEGLDATAAAEELASLAAHPSPSVRQAAIERLAQASGAQPLSVMRQRLRDETDPSVLGGALRTLATVGGEPEEIRPYLNRAEPAVRAGALAGLLCGAPAGRGPAEELLAGLAVASDAVDRAVAARAIGEAADAGQARLLESLLTDPATSVRRAALGAARAVRGPGIWPAVVGALEEPETRGQALSALSAGGAAAAAAVGTALAGSDLAPRAAIPLLRVAGRIESDGAAPLLDSVLTRIVESSHPELRRGALLALGQRGYRPDDAGRSRLDASLRGEVAEAAKLLAALVDVGEGEHDALLRSGLAQAIDGCRERVVLLLERLYPGDTVERARHTLSHGSPERRSNALEALDTLLARDHKELVIPLVEDLQPEERLARLRARFPQRRLGRFGRLSEIASAPGGRYSRWLSTCARHALTTIEGGDAVLSLIEKVLVLKGVSIFAETPDEVLAEIAALLDDVDVAPEETLITKGEPGRAMYVVVAGRLRIHDGERVIAYSEGHDIVGEMAVLESVPRMASVTATEPTRLLRLEQDALYELMADRIEVARGIIRVLSGRLRERVRDMAELRDHLSAVGTR